MNIGIWIDGPAPTEAQIPAWADEIASTGARLASLWCVGTPLHLPRWGARALLLATQALRERGLVVRWTIWGDSRPDRIQEQRAAWAQIVPAFWAAGEPLAEIEVDLEEAWRDGAGAALLAQELGTLGLTITACNSVPGPKVSKAVRAVLDLPGVQEWTLQAYSQYTEKEWTHDPLVRPVTFQAYAARFAQPPLEAGIVTRWRCGLITINQAHPAPHPRGIAALDAAADEALRHTDLLCLWSWKHLRGQGAVLDWVRGLARV